MGNKVAAGINLLFGLIMLGLAVGIPVVTGRQDLGFLIGMGGLGAGGLVCLLIGIFFLKGGASSKLLATGQPATAVIKNVRETGITLQKGMYIILDFNLEVGFGTGAPYQAVCRSTVPRIALGNVGVGKVVVVKVDPANPSRVAIDWSAIPS